MGDHNLVTIWTVLSQAAPPTDGSLVLAPAASLADGRQVLAGLDRQGDRHVLVPLLASEQFRNAGQGRALQLRVVQLPEGRFASTICTDRRLDDIFVQFGRELVGSIVNSGKPGRDMRVAFGRWRSLFSDGPGTRLTRSEEIGLLAELITLRALLELGGSVDSWHGPSKALHDFRAGPNHLEVKATLAREGLAVTIHGVDQLDVPSGEWLNLLVYRFAESEAGTSLVDVIREVEAVVDDLPHFEVQLRKSGFDWQYASSYETGFVVSDSRCFDVLVPGFPRIVSDSFSGGSMPDRTMRLSYVADLSGPTPEPLSEETKGQVMRKLATA